MEVILRKNTTDDEMVDIVTKSPSGIEILWGVVHMDFIHGESIVMDEIMNQNGEVTVTLEIKLEHCKE